jgi:hypothetical protein
LVRPEYQVDQIRSKDGDLPINGVGLELWKLGYEQLQLFDASGCVFPTRRLLFQIALCCARSFGRTRPDYFSVSLLDSAILIVGAFEANRSVSIVQARSQSRRRRMVSFNVSFLLFRIECIELSRNEVYGG